MALSTVRDVDFIVARIHAHHASMVEGGRLDEMCRIRTVPELARRLWDDATPTMTSAEFQRRVVAEYAAEIDKLALSVPEGVRLFFEMLKEGKRALAHQSLEADTAAATKYYAELISRARNCAPPNGRPAYEIAAQSASIFLGMLALRLVFNYAMKPALVGKYYFDGTFISRQVFDGIVAASELQPALDLCSSAIAGGVPCRTIPELEAAAWDRYLMLAHRLWRSDPIGVGAIIGYVGIRRIEIANLVTLSEGLRLGVESRRLRSYLIPHQPLKETHHA